MAETIYTIIAECDSESSSDEEYDPLWGSRSKSLYWSVHGSTIKGSAVNRKTGNIYVQGPGNLETRVSTDQSHTVREVLALCQCEEICENEDRYQIYICDGPLNLDKRTDESELVFWGQTIIIVDTFYKYWKWNALFPSPGRRYISNDWNVLPFEPVEEVQKMLKDGAVWVEILWSYTPTVPDSFQLDRHWWVAPKRKNEYMLKAIPFNKYV